ncbi:MAG: response regulator [Flavihumibacter sp.]
MKKKILVITESKAIRFLLQTVLNDDYLTVPAAEAGEAMAQLSKTATPAAIIIDSELPHMEPWELVEHLKTSRLYQHIPMVVISADDEEMINRHTMELGVESTFRKPFNPIDLKQKLDILVNQRQEAVVKHLKVV